MHGVDILKGDDALTGEFLDENLRVVNDSQFVHLKSSFSCRYFYYIDRIQIDFLPPSGDKNTPKRLDTRGAFAYNDLDKALAVLGR